MSSPVTPSFWIRLRPEHIDQNTDSFLAFLSARRANAAGDPAYAESFNLLEERCTQIWSTVTSSFPGDTDEDALRLGARLFGARTLLKSEDNRECSRKAFAQMLHCLACLVPSQTVPLVRVLSRALTCREVLSTGFGWKNITGGDSPEVITAVILAGAEFSGETLADRWFENEGRGAVHLSGGRIGAWPVNRDSARINALPVGFSHGATGTQVHLPVKVRTADKRDFTRLDAVIRSFMNAAESLRPSPPPALLRYVDGDILPVRYLSTDRFGNMVVESADAEHERVTGIIRKDMPAARTYTCDDLTELLEKGDVFLAKWNARNSRFMLHRKTGKKAEESEVRLPTIWRRTHVWARRLFFIPNRFPSHCLLFVKKPRPREGDDRPAVLLSRQRGLRSPAGKACRSLPPDRGIVILWNYTK